MAKIEFTAALAAITAAFPRSPEHLQRFWAGCARDAAAQGGSVESFIADLKSKQAKSASEDRALRAALRENFDRYRITATDQVEVYGVMPNTNQIGWYFYGDRKEAALRLDLA
jgi:hypothetical protein